MRREDGRTSQAEIDAEIRNVHGFSSSPVVDGIPDDEYELMTRPFSPTEVQERDMRDLGASFSSSKTDETPVPVDIWARASKPPLIEGLLPKLIEDFAKIRSEIMGADPAGLAMAALCACAASIPDSIAIQPKRNDSCWTESARIWIALVGLPSTMKSPIITVATSPLRRLDQDLYRQWATAKTEYDGLDKDARKSADAPRHKRLVLEDTTSEAAQEVLRDSPDGVLLIRDELSGWFGSMDKYSGGGRGAAVDRAFWLQAFNGGPYTINRVGRGASVIPNLSASLIGGIQPEPIRAIANDMQDDGLLQRLFPIVLRAAQAGQDVPLPDVAAEYSKLLDRLTRLRKPLYGGMEETSVRFSPEAQKVWEAVESRRLELQAAWEAVNIKFAAHIGKYSSMYARLCLTFHCVEAEGDRPPQVISEDTARRVQDFLFFFLYPHARAFYTDVIGLSDKQDEVQAVAGWILAHRPEIITHRDVARGDSTMRKMGKERTEAVMEQLDACGWLSPVPARRSDSRVWNVNPTVYELFRQKADDEAKRRATIHKLIAEETSY